MVDKNYVYIGNGEIKYLDKNETKLGAFFKVDIDQLITELNKLKSENAELKEVLIYALPNKLGSHSVKLKVDNYGKKSDTNDTDMLHMQ